LPLCPARVTVTSFPVIPEAVAMACADVIGNDVTVTLSGQSGNFQLNVMLPVVAYNLLKSISLMSNSMPLLANKAIKTFKVNKKNIEESLGMNPILVTALNREIGYEKAAYIAKKAYKEKRSIIDVAHEETGLSLKQLKTLLNLNSFMSFEISELSIIQPSRSFKNSIC
jgi:fumarate hydratase class II